MPTIFTESILKPRDGKSVGVSVMNRHTLSDGITPDLRITLESYNEHLQSVAPPANLLGDYYKRGLTWEDYEVRYLEHIRQPEISQEVQQLASRALREDITLLCIEETAEKCHRRLLAEECQRYQPSLKVVHR